MGTAGEDPETGGDLEAGQGGINPVGVEVRQIRLGMTLSDSGGRKGYPC